MIYLALIILALLSIAMYCCAIIGGRCDDAMGYKDKSGEE